MGARNQGREIFIFNFDPRHVILGIFISKNLSWASVYDFYINDFQGTWAFLQKISGSLGLQFNSWGVQVLENFHSKKLSTRQKLLFENRIKKIGMIIKNWLENCHFSNEWSIFVSKNVFIYFENFWVGIIFSISLRKLISCWKNCFWFSSYSSSLFSSCHQSRNRTISENVKMAQNTHLTHKQPKFGFLTDSYKNLRIPFVKDGRGQARRNAKLALQVSDKLNCGFLSTLVLITKNWSLLKNSISYFEHLVNKAHSFQSDF